MDKSAWIWIALSFVCACTTTASGPDDVDVPVGAELARSDLARVDAPSLSEQERETFGKDNRAFALALYRELAMQPGNLFFSPYSISSALAMTYAGAKGETAAEMEQALHFGLGQDRLHGAFNATDSALAQRKDEVMQSGAPEPASSTTGDGFELRIVNQAWGRKGYTFLESYLDVLAQNYGAGLFLLDFDPPEPARVLINDWVEQQTNARIKDLLPEGSLDPSTALVLTNAIYFKTSWLSPFDADMTRPATFHAEAGDRDVDMMHASLDARYAQLEGFEMVELLYLSDDVSMLVVLPPAGVLADSVAAFEVQRFDELRAKLSRHQVTLGLPKWSFEAKYELKAPLKTLGMQAAFQAGDADLSGMDGMPGHLYVDEVYHKAFVAVDEQGTEAAAATAVVIKETSAPPPVEVTFDRPFMFAVYDAPTGQILFFGHVAEP